MAKNIFHITNRGVDGRRIFLNRNHYLRFIHNLYDFNTINNVLPYPKRRNKNSELDVRRPTSEELVDVLCWSLMSNHPHVLIQEKIDNGVSMYSRKLFDGFTRFFNDIHDRKGVLFQGGSKRILIQRDSHFLYIPFYILANPLDYFQPSWREERIKNPKKAFEFLENYQWSALPDLMGKRSFSEIINKNLFFELFDTNEKEFKKEFVEWLANYETGNGRTSDVLPGDL